MSLRFHLERQTGGMTRDIERGTRAVHSLISYSLYSIFPTLIEVALVLSILAVKFDMWFAWITIAALVLYIVFTIVVTEWRTQFRKQMNELDSTAHSRAIDSLLNYETVKYFNNEEFEARRYDENLERYRKAALKSQTTLSLLNTGQQLIIAAGLVAMLWRATQGVVDGRMTLGDLVMVNDTVEYNIAYGQPGATREQVIEAAQSAHIHNFIAATPKGYDTMVGERGLKLSGGEKQRVAIARTLLKNPPILIFDEATSALDSANERAIQAELQSVAQNKTTLVIAHRLSTVVDAHEILVMEAGHILERGTHAALLASGGRYAQMWALQQSAE
jgi:ABC-type transport system involved in Fe-S cluster assembly fused permease/ATPase subunit